MAKKSKPDGDYALQLAYDTLVEAINDPDSTPAQRIRAAKELIPLGKLLKELNGAGSIDALTEFLAKAE